MCVLTVVPRVLVEASPRSRAEASGDWEQDLPDWLELCTEGLVEGESGSSSSAHETIPKTETQFT